MVKTAAKQECTAEGPGFESRLVHFYCSWRLLGCLFVPPKTNLEPSGASWASRERPKSRQERPKTRQERPKSRQERPKGRQERPKSRQERPKSRREAPEKRPEGPPESPWSAPGGPKAAGGPRGPPKTRKIRLGSNKTL